MSITSQVTQTGMRETVKSLDESVDAGEITAQSLKPWPDLPHTLTVYSDTRGQWYVMSTPGRVLTIKYFDGEDSINFHSIEG